VAFDGAFTPADNERELLYENIDEEDDYYIRVVRLYSDTDYINTDITDDKDVDTDSTEADYDEDIEKILAFDIMHTSGMGNDC
jgi:hypothetical protein